MGLGYTEPCQREDDLPEVLLIGLDWIGLDWIYCESGEAHANQRQRGVAEDPDLSNEADRAGVAGMQ